MSPSNELEYEGKNKKYQTYLGKKNHYSIGRC